MAPSRGGQFRHDGRIHFHCRRLTKKGGGHGCIFLFFVNRFPLTEERFGSKLGSPCHSASLLLPVTSLLLLVFFLHHKSRNFSKARARLFTCRAGQLCSERGTPTSGAAALHPRRMRPAASAKGTSQRGDCPRGYCTGESCRGEGIVQRGKWRRRRP